MVSAEADGADPIADFRIHDLGIEIDLDAIDLATQQQEVVDNDGTSKEIENDSFVAQ
ncbi:MAG: hypothetical protein GF411_19330 [Candidatus Lokiarchaeota archaeon]|nr:hypothetical protein [Candidatus Lokiarchaeota archaeon]